MAIKNSLSVANPEVTAKSALKIFLIGMMGSGKSYWADKLKKKLKIPAYDLDNLVEIMEERTISEIFSEDGEAYFRKEETKMMKLFKEKKQFILSCGGGTPCFNDNMDWMNKQGITIWINEPVEILKQRLAGEKEHRPLINHFSIEELASFLALKLEERTPFYSKAHYTLHQQEINEQNFLKIIKQHA